MSGWSCFFFFFLTLIFVICQVDLSALFTTRQQPIPDHEQVITRKAFVHHHHLLTPNQGRVRLGIFWNKNVFQNVFRLFLFIIIILLLLFCSWEQNSQNGIQVFRNENSSQANAYLHYSNYSYSGLIPNERALRMFFSTCGSSRLWQEVKYGEFGGIYCEL